MWIGRKSITSLTSGGRNRTIKGMEKLITKCPDCGTRITSVGGMNKVHWWAWLIAGFLAGMFAMLVFFLLLGAYDRASRQKKMEKLNPMRDFKIDWVEWKTDAAGENWRRGGK